MYEKFIFDPKEVLNMMKKSAEFLAEKELLLDAYMGKDKRAHKGICFYLSEGKIIMYNMKWRAVEIANDSFWFSDYDYTSKAIDKINKVYNHLSKNNQKKYAKVYSRLKEQITYKRIEHYLKFLYDNMAIAYSTSYGFDGGTIIIQKIYPYDRAGKERETMKNQMRVNNEKIDKLRKEIELLQKDNHSVAQKLNNQYGGKESIVNMRNVELLSLIKKPIYAIRNFHKGANHRNFYISTMEIKNIIISADGVWVDTGFEIFHESEFGNRFSFSYEEIQKTLEYVKEQQLNNISEIFKICVINRDALLRR